MAYIKYCTEYSALHLLSYIKIFTFSLSPPTHSLPRFHRGWQLITYSRILIALVASQRRLAVALASTFLYDGFRGGGTQHQNVKIPEF